MPRLTHGLAAVLTEQVRALLWLDHPERDLNLRLCWTSENWTRRWDGLDSEILVAQNDSPEDDLALIAEVAAYLRDRRYLRPRRHADCNPATKASTAPGAHPNRRG